MKNTSRDGQHLPIAVQARMGTEAQAALQRNTSILVLIVWSRFFRKEHVTMSWNTVWACHLAKCPRLSCITLFDCTDFAFTALYQCFLGPLFLCEFKANSKMFHFSDPLKYYIPQCLICVSLFYFIFFFPPGKSKNKCFHDNIYLYISFMFWSLSVSQNWAFSVILKAFTGHNKSFCYIRNRELYKDKSK